LGNADPVTMTLPRLQRISHFLVSILSMTAFATLQMIRRTTLSPDNFINRFSLSNREFMVVELIMQRYSNRKCRCAIHQRKTVKTHITNTLRKCS
jgi:ATP/maltotriose-dependent transcriptional regulator MalT